MRRDTTTTRQTIHASTTTPASSGSAHVDLQLLRTNARGVPHLDLRVTVKGMVPQLYSDADGSPVAGTQQDLNTRIDYGDGSLMEGTDGGGVSCKPGARLVPIDMTFNWSHDYTTSGQHTVTFKVALCQLGVVSRATTVTS